MVTGILFRLLESASAGRTVVEVEVDAGRSKPRPYKG
jgi:hypothetical protein